MLDRFPLQVDNTRETDGRARREFGGGVPADRLAVDRGAELADIFDREAAGFGSRRMRQCSLDTSGRVSSLRSTQ